MADRLHACICESDTAAQVEVTKLAGWHNGSFREDIDFRLNTMHHNLEGFVVEFGASAQNQPLQVICLENSLGSRNIVESSNFTGPKIPQSRASLYDCLDTSSIYPAAPGNIDGLELRAGLGNDLAGCV